MIFGNPELNPKGIPAQSPGLPSPRGYPGWGSELIPTPTGLRAAHHDDATPLGLKTTERQTQGSSCLPPSLRYGAARATLGWRAQSLWDWTTAPWSHLDSRKALVLASRDRFDMGGAASPPYHFEGAGITRALGRRASPSIDASRFLTLPPPGLLPGFGQIAR